MPCLADYFLIGYIFLALFINYFISESDLLKPFKTHTHTSHSLFFDLTEIFATATNL